MDFNFKKGQKNCTMLYLSLANIIAMQIRLCLREAWEVRVGGGGGGGASPFVVRLRVHNNLIPKLNKYGKCRQKLLFSFRVQNIFDSACRFKKIYVCFIN